MKSFDKKVSLLKKREELLKKNGVYKKLYEREF